MKADALKRLTKAVNSKVDFEVGDVVKFKSVSRNRGQEVNYDYAAIFAGDHRWYLTGTANYYGNRLTTEDFLQVLRNSDVHEVRVAMVWQAI